jgi:hypothetical protein
MSTAHEHDDLTIPPALVTALDEAAATVPRVEHDLSAVRRRAHRLRQRRFAATGAAAAVLAIGGLGVVRLGTIGDDTEVLVPGSVSGWERSSQSATLLVPSSPPDGWALEWLDASVVADEYDGPATSQLFAVDGRSPLGRGIVVTSGRAAAPMAEEGEGTHAVRGHPATLDSWDSESPSSPLAARWTEDGVAHSAVSVGLTEDELLDALEPLVPHEDPTTGYAAPAGSSLPELDTVVDEERSMTRVGYRGPGDQEISVTAQSPGVGTLLSRLQGEPRGDELVTRVLEGDHPQVTHTRADGSTVTVVAETGSPAPDLLDAFAEDVEPVTVEQLVDSGWAGPATTLATVDDLTVEVHGSEGHDVAVCLTPASESSVCAGAAVEPDAGFTSASFVVDGKWTMVTVTDGDEPGQVIAEPEGGWAESTDPRPGEVLHGDLAPSGDRIVEVVTIPDDVDAVIAQSPPTESGTSARGWFRPN